MHELDFDHPLELSNKPPKHISDIVDFNDIWIHDQIDRGLVTNRAELVEYVKERIEVEVRSLRSSLYDCYADCDRFLERLEKSQT